MQESSPILHYKKFIRPVMSAPDVEWLIETIWQAGVAHGTKMTNMAHEILDEPDLVLTELVEPSGIYVKAPHRTDLKPVVRSKYEYHYRQIKNILVNGFNFMPYPAEHRKFKKRV